MDDSDGSATITITDNDTRVPDGLVAYYPLDEDGPISTRYQQFSDTLGQLEGNITYDRSGRGQNLTLATRRDMWGATPNWVPDSGVFGGALEFHCRIEDFYHRHQRETGAAIEFPVGDCSLALWVKSTEPDGGLLEVRENVNSAGLGGEGQLLMSLRYENGAAVAQGPGGTELRGSAASIGDGNWHHIAYVIDAAKTQQRLYVDGVEEGAGPVTKKTIIYATYFLTRDFRCCSIGSMNKDRTIRMTRLTDSR